MASQSMALGNWYLVYGIQKLPVTLNSKTKLSIIVVQKKNLRTITN